MLEHLGILNIFGEDGSDIPGFDFSDETLHFLRGGLVGCRNALNSKNLEAVILGKIPQRLVGGDEHSICFGEGCDLEADPFGQDGKAAVEFFGVCLVGGLTCGIGGDECVAYLRRHGLDIRNAVPPMRIGRAVAVCVVVIRMSFTRRLDRFDDISTHDEADAGFFQTRTQLVEVAFKAKAAGEEDLGFGDGFSIPRRGFVNVGIDSGFDDFGHLHALGADVASQISHHRAERGHAKRLGLGKGQACQKGGSNQESLHKKRN